MICPRGYPILPFVNTKNKIIFGLPAGGCAFSFSISSLSMSLAGVDSELEAEEDFFFCFNVVGVVKEEVILWFGVFEFVDFGVVEGEMVSVELVWENVFACHTFDFRDPLIALMLELKVSFSQKKKKQKKYHFVEKFFTLHSPILWLLC